MLCLGGGWDLLPAEDEGKPARPGSIRATEQQMEVLVTDSGGLFW